MLSHGVFVVEPEDWCSVWGRLCGWVQRRIKQISHGALDRLPPLFDVGEGRIALQGYRTVLLAMEVVQGRAPSRDIISLSLPFAVTKRALS